jgi:U4/U6 small nuclear ribonucleoprotein PRP3
VFPSDASAVKLSNLMRVLTTEATMDPTRIEQEVRRQMDDRRQAHEDRNHARMLTADEKCDREKERESGVLAERVAGRKSWFGN